MIKNKKISLVSLLLSSFLLFAGCVPLKPHYTEDDKEEFKKNASPYVNDVIYDEALDTIGRYINEEISYKRIVQSKPIGNSAGGEDLPFNLTNMVITSLSRIAGRKLIVAPFDPEFINNDAVTGGRGSRILPNLVIAGSITEFDKDIDAVENDLDLDLLLDRGKPDTNTGLGYSNSKKMSRITLDLYLLDYKTHAVIPGVSITNTVNVIEMKKGQDFAFAIYGSGIGIGGKIKHTHGFHRAVRNLVDYSILQLMGRYYNIPYWRAMGINDSDPDVINSLKHSFSRKSPRKKMLVIQKLLTNYDFKDVRNPDTGKLYSELRPDGVNGKKTQAYIERFKTVYNIQVPGDDMEALFISLVENLPLVPKDNNERLNVDGSETGRSQDFYNSLDKVDRVYNIPSILR